MAKALRAQRSLKVHFEKGESREETLLGRDYLVVPVVAMVEGVRMGAAQTEPELGLASEFGGVPIAWANRPLVLNHPQEDDAFVSANTPAILEAYQFGLTMNPQLKGKKLHMEAWIDTARVESLGGDFQTTYDRIVAQEDVEVSVGFYSDIEEKKGRFNGQAYSAVWRNIKPDHLAVLTDGLTGACSVADGCGVPRLNQKGDDMAKQPTTNGQCSCGGAHAQSEHVDEEEVRVNETDEGIEVMIPKRKATSVPQVRTNASPEVSEEQKLLDLRRAANAAILAQTMNTTLLDREVSTLISQAARKKFKTYVYLYGYNKDVAVFEKYDDKGGGYCMYQIGLDVQGADVKFVGEPEEVILQTKIVRKDKVELSTNAKENDMSDKDDKSEDKTKTQATAVETNVAPKTQEAPKVLTAEEYIQNAPPEIRDFMAGALKAQNVRKEACIKALKEAPGNKFSEDYLKTQSVDVLENMIALLPPSYAGVALPIPPVTQNSGTEESKTVPVPKIQWGKPASAEKTAA